MFPVRSLHRGVSVFGKLKGSGYFLSLEGQCEAVNRRDQRKQRIIVDGSDPFIVDHGSMV
jgi:hypothetical protein